MNPNYFSNFDYRSYIDEVRIKYEYYMRLTRTCIYAKDIQRITGRSERYCRKILSDIRVKLNKKSHQFITLEEFSDYAGIKLETVRKYIID